MKLSRLTQAAIEGLISTSKTFQDVKDKCRTAIMAITSLASSIDLVAQAVQQNTAMIQAHDVEIQRLNMMASAMGHRMREGSLEMSLPELSKRNDEEDKPN